MVSLMVGVPIRQAPHRDQLTAKESLLAEACEPPWREGRESVAICLTWVHPCRSEGVDDMAFPFSVWLTA